MQWVKRGEGASSIRTRVSLIGGGMSPACATHNVYYTYTHIHTDIHRYTHNVYYTYTHRYTHKYTDIHICKYIYIYIYHICRFMCCFHDFYEKVYDHHHDGGGDPNDNLCRIEKCYLRGTSPHLRSIWSVRLPSPQLTPTIQTQALFSSYESSQSFSLSLNEVLYIDMLNIAKHCLT